MTEAEWLTCTDPQKMLEFLRGKASDRKLRLFICNCCKYALECFYYPELENAIYWCDLYLEGEDSQQDWAQLYDDINWARGEMCETLNDLGEAVAILIATELMDTTGASRAVEFLIGAFECNDIDGSIAEAYAKMAQIVREHFSYPCSARPGITSWLTPTATSIAETIYQERAFDRMPILADALEDAGCGDKDILNHCRSGGDHVRGCWVVDLVTGRE